MGYAASQASITGASDLGNLPMSPPAYSVRESNIHAPRPLAIVSGSVASEPQQSRTDNVQPEGSSRNSQGTGNHVPNSVNKAKNEADVVRDAAALLQGPKPDDVQGHHEETSEEEASSSEGSVNETSLTPDSRLVILNSEADNAVSGRNNPVPGDCHPVSGPDNPVSGQEISGSGSDSPIPGQDNVAHVQGSPVSRPDNCGLGSDYPVSGPESSGSGSDNFIPRRDIPDSPVSRPVSLVSGLPNTEQELHNNGHEI
jgi:hypothetical protein